MSGIIKNKMVMSVFAVCVIMHVVALMPHHHHKDNSVPCLNYSHIIHSHDTLCEHHCDGPHEHGDSSPVNCSTHKIIVAGPERPELEFAACESSLPDDFSSIFSVRSGIIRRISCDEATRQFAEYRSGPDIAVPLTEYIVSATPSRAPDLIA